MSNVVSEFDVLNIMLNHEVYWMPHFKDTFICFIVFDNLVFDTCTTIYLHDDLIQ